MTYLSLNLHSSYNLIRGLRRLPAGPHAGHAVGLFLGSGFGCWGAPMYEGSCGRRLQCFKYVS